MIWFINVSAPLLTSQFQIGSWQRLSVDDRYLQVRMKVGYTYQVFLCMTLEHGHRHILKDNLSQLALIFHCHLQ